MNKKVLFFILICVFFLLFLNTNKKEKENIFEPDSIEEYQIDRVLNVVDNDLELENSIEEAFKEGYINGKNAYLAQINNKNFEYSSFASYKQITKTQRKRLEEENQRGYVEGYHQATLEEFCPSGY